LFRVDSVRDLLTKLDYQDFSLSLEMTKQTI
jgi:hypothetical protein